MTDREASSDSDSSRVRNEDARPRPDDGTHTYEPARKLERSPFDPLVKRVFPGIERRVPAGITANQVTVVGHVASAVAAASLLLASRSELWCLVAAVMIVVHWFADTLDGPMARRRGSSRLGHFLDHFGDAVDTVIILLAMFHLPGSHPAIGVCIALIYLLSFIFSRIRAEIVQTLEIPPFGPTELHLVGVLALFAEVVVNFGGPVSPPGSLTGEGGFVASLLGSENGLTLIDHVGIVIAALGLLGLVVDSIAFGRKLHALDEGDRA